MHEHHATIDKATGTIRATMRESTIKIGGDTSGIKFPSPSTLNGQPYPAQAKHLGTSITSNFTTAAGKSARKTT